jgi:LacI family transcriptional regulator/LacI family repressor for deo operon, udp, cdd, tsx, nupC, and nupG
MRKQSVSIEDIARTAGVSHSTVSRALRDSPLISVAVREQLQSLARDLGYTPNAIAQSLQGQRTNTIGLVVTSIADPFLSDVVKGVEEVARTADLSVFLSASHNDAEQEMAVIETFHRRRVDGILVAASQLTSDHAERLARINVPTVLINHEAETQYDLLHSAAVDDYQGAQLAVEHLLALRHRAIGYIGVGNRPKSNRRRLEGYCDALAQAGIQPDTTWRAIAPAEDNLHHDDVAAGQALLMPLLAAGVTAIFCYNDMVAIGALLACREHAVAVPGDLSIIGFDDVEIAQYITPPLTTMHQPKATLGRTAMQMLLDLLDKRPVQNHVLPPTLVQRGSTASALSAQGLGVGEYSNPK